MEISIINDNMTSLQIAKATGKRHSDVLRDMRNMGAAWDKVTGRNFALSNYKDSSGRSLPMYQLSKPEILFVASKYNDELRAKIILRLYELEVQNKKMMQSQLDYFWDKQDQKDLYR